MVEEIKYILNKFYINTQFSLGIIDGDTIKYYGFKKHNNTIQQIENQDSVFEIGSITKIFTSYVLSALVLEKKIALADPISKYLTINPTIAKEISIKQLANHTSGLPRLPNNFYDHGNYNEKDPYNNYDENCLKDYLEGQLKLETEPGLVFNYSNLGYGLLSYIISKIEGGEFQAIVKKRIFGPLKMAKSSFVMNGIISGIDQFGKTSTNWNGGILNGCIGITSTTEDLTKYMQALLKADNEIAKLQVKASYKVDNDYYIGLGWGIRNTTKGKTISHGGGSAGYNSYIKLNRAHKKGMILLSNVSAFHENRVELEDLSKKIMLAI